VRGVHVRLPGHDNSAVPPPLPLQRLRGLPPLPGQQLSHLPRSLQGSSPGTVLPHPNFSHPGSRVNKISDPGSGSAAKKLSILCSSRIRIFIFYPSRIPDPGVKKTLDPGTQANNCPVCRAPFRALLQVPVLDPGCYPGSRIRFFNTKNCFKARGNGMRDVHAGSGSRIRILIFLPIPDPGVKKAPYPGPTIVPSAALP
jgi:hypothetical protein